MKNRYMMNLFFGVVFLQSLAANFAHPITPTLIKILNLPDYMFGLAFAAMSFTLFLFSPFWGKMRDFFSARLLLLIGSVGYGIGQFLFGVSKTEGSILFARFVSGFFVGAIGVSILIYITEKSPKEKVGENLAHLAIIQALGSSFGYFIGGSVGVYSIPITFYLQVGTLFLCGGLFYFLLEDTEKKEMNTVTVKTLLPEMNPFKSFLDCRSLLTKPLFIILYIILLVTIGTSSFDQSFNYYLKAEFNFSSLYNGVLKAVNGIVTLLLVSTVCLRIIRKGKIAKSSSGILFLSIFSIIGIMFFHQKVIFLSLAILFYTFNAMMNPLLQDLVVKEGAEGKKNMLMGLYNSIKSLGMILGALLAGFLYGYGANTPFILATVCFFMAGITMFFNYKENK